MKKNDGNSLIIKGMWRQNRHTPYFSLSLSRCAEIRRSFSSTTMETPNIEAAYVTHWATYQRTDEWMECSLRMKLATASPAPVSSINAAVNDLKDKRACFIRASFLKHRHHRGSCLSHRWMTLRCRCRVPRRSHPDIRC